MSNPNPRILPTHELNARRRRIDALKRLPALAPVTPQTTPTPLATGRQTVPGWLLSPSQPVTPT